MKSGVSVLNHDTGFRNMKKDLVRRYGKEAAERIWEKAGHHLDDLCERYADLPPKVKVHTDGNMFRNAALYMALKEEYPADAVKIMESGVEKEGKRVAKLLSALLRWMNGSTVICPDWSSAVPGPLEQARTNAISA